MSDPTNKASTAVRYDLLIKGGTVYDGTGEEPISCDIGISGDRIVAMGELPAVAEKTINAKGLVVAPGFIDIHTHCDLSFQNTGLDQQLEQLPGDVIGNLNYLHQGVTTVVTGNCGYGYTDTDAWLSMVERIGFGTNVSHLVPHGMIRQELFGEDQPGQLRTAQLSRMRARLSEEMEKGAFGMSSGLEYLPGMFSDTAELVELCRTIHSHNGLYATHRRDETGRLNDKGALGLKLSMQEAIEVGEKAEVPVQVSHLKIASPRNHAVAMDLLEMLDEARSRGMDITADQYPYEACNTYISLLLPNEFKSGNSVKEEFRTNSGRKVVARAAREIFTYLGPEKIQVDFCPTDPSCEGKTVQQISEAMGEPPEVVYTILACEKQNPSANIFTMDETDVKSIMQADYVFTASDGYTVPMNVTSPHPRCYGTFPRKITRYVLRDKTLDMSTAIRSMSSLPAEKLGLKERGRLVRGSFADIVIFDPASLEAKSTYQHPHQYSVGVMHLLVNGVLALENGKETGSYSGRGLRKR